MNWIIVGCAVLLGVGNILWCIALLKQGKTILELSKLLASRTFSEYSIGQARLAETRREQKPAEEDGYESVWQRGDDNG